MPAAAISCSMRDARSCRSPRISRMTVPQLGPTVQFLHSGCLVENTPHQIPVHNHSCSKVTRTDGNMGFLIPVGGLPAPRADIAEAPCPRLIRGPCRSVGWLGSRRRRFSAVPEPRRHGARLRQRHEDPLHAGLFFKGLSDVCTDLCQPSRKKALALGRLCEMSACALLEVAFSGL